MFRYRNGSPKRKVADKGKLNLISAACLGCQTCKCSFNVYPNALENTSISRLSAFIKANMRAYRKCYRQTS